MSVSTSLVIIIFSALTFLYVWVASNPYTKNGSQGTKAFINKLLLTKTSNTGRLVLLIFLVQFLGIAYLPFSSGALGVSLNILGLILCVWAKFEMKQNWGEPATFDKERQKKLVTTGPFSFSRNPIYLGLILMLLGQGLALRTPLVVFVFIAIAHFKKIAIKEEIIMLENFPENYPKYREKVARFIGFPKFP